MRVHALLISASLALFSAASSLPHPIPLATVDCVDPLFARPRAMHRNHSTRHVPEVLSWDALRRQHRKASSWRCQSQPQPRTTHGEHSPATSPSSLSSSGSSSFLVLLLYVPWCDLDYRAPFRSLATAFPNATFLETPRGDTFTLPGYTTPQRSRGLPAVLVLNLTHVVSWITPVSASLSELEAVAGAVATALDGGGGGDRRRPGNDDGAQSEGQQTEGRKSGGGKRPGPGMGMGMNIGPVSLGPGRPVSQGKPPGTRIVRREQWLVVPGTSIVPPLLDPTLWAMAPPAAAGDWDWYLSFSWCYLVVTLCSGLGRWAWKRYGSGGGSGEAT